MSSCMVLVCDGDIDKRIFHDGVLVGSSTRTPAVQEMTQDFFSHWHCFSTFNCQNQFICDTSKNGPGMSPVFFMDLVAWFKLGRRTWSHIRSSKGFVVKRRQPYASARVNMVIWAVSSKTVK